MILAQTALFGCKTHDLGHQKHDVGVTKTRLGCKRHDVGAQITIFGKTSTFSQTRL